MNEKIIVTVNITPITIIRSEKISNNTLLNSEPIIAYEEITEYKKLAIE